MINAIISLVLASLLLTTGVNILTSPPVDFSFLLSEVADGPAPKRIVNDSLGIATTAQSILIVDQASGKTLYSKNASEPRSIASITKLVTALTFLDYNPGWDTPVTITEADRRDGNIIYLLAGETVTVRDLFQLMLVASANEAAAALARSTGLTLEEFVSAMNRKAYAIGMANSQFIDPAGLSPANLATPADLVSLATVAFSQTDIAAAVTARRYETTSRAGRPISVQSTDQLLDSFINRDRYQILGAKTGYLEEAGYCLVTTVQHDGAAAVVVILGAADQPSRWQEAKGLVDWIFANYRWSDNDF